jgi:NTE family protein
VPNSVFITRGEGRLAFGRSAKVGFDWVRQLRLILDVTDNRVRALRRRNFIDRLAAGKVAFEAGTLEGTETHDGPRLGTYWDVDRDTHKASPLLTDRLARASTRLAALGETVSKRLANWCYAICVRCVRTYYRGSNETAHIRPAWLYAEAGLQPARRFRGRST